MKKMAIFALLVLVLALAACGTPQQPSSPPEEEITTLAVNTNPPPPPPPPSPPPVECCGKVKTFLLVSGIYVPLGGATNVPVTSTISIGFSEAQVPSNVRLSLSPSVGCAWQWSSDKTSATCVATGPLGSVRGYLAYATTYTIKVDKRACFRIYCYWSNNLTASFSTQYPLIFK